MHLEFGLGSQRTQEACERQKLEGEFVAQPRTALGRDYRHNFGWSGFRFVAEKTQTGFCKEEEAAEIGRMLLPLLPWPFRQKLVTVLCPRCVGSLNPIASKTSWCCRALPVPLPQLE
jgi:hypothetical protein